MTSLALKYRPRVYADVYGQKAVAAVLWSIAKRGTPPPGILLHGPSGTGKTTMARIFGSSLNCEAGPGPGTSWPCMKCSSCLAVVSGASLAVREIDAASFGTAADVRALRERAMYGAAPGEHRLVILDECHAMSPAAFNALLKILEEPPEGITWVLLTTEAGRVLDTVNGRCLPFRFRRVPSREIASRLAWICSAEGLSMDQELLEHLAGQAAGQVRNAVMLLEQAAAVGISTVEMWRKLHGESDFAPALLTAAASGDYASARAVLHEALQETGDYAWVAAQLAGCLSDLLVLSGGGETDFSGIALASREALAARLDVSLLAGAMSVLWDLMTRVRPEDRRAGLELAVQEITGRLAPKPKDTYTVTGNGHRARTAEELSSMFGVSA